MSVQTTHLDRYHARIVKNAILAENPHTFMRVERGQLVVKCDGLTPKQRELALAHKDELIAYLTTPPASVAQCNNCKRPIEWVCNKHGDWVCSCYHRERLLNHQTLYTFGYLKTSIGQILKELKSQNIPLVDVRFKPTSSHWEWTQTALQTSLGPLYHHIGDLGNEVYKTARDSNYTEHKIKIHNIDRGLRQLKDILDRQRRAAIFCACTGKGCHRFEVASQCEVVFPNLKIIHL